jgi:intracellular multiplication protein IcmP
MSQGNPQQGGMKNDYDGLTTALVAVGAIVVFAVLMWLMYHTELATAYIFIRNIMNWVFWQLHITLLQSGINFPLFKYLIGSTLEQCVPSQRFNIFTTCVVDPSVLTFKQLQNSSMGWNAIFALISLTIAGLGFVRIGDDHPDSKFKKKHTLESFMLEQKVNYSHLHVFTDFNLQLVSVNEGPFMGMKTTREYARDEGLIVGSKERQVVFAVSGTTRSKKDQSEHVPVIDREKLKGLLRTQLGGLWIGCDFITDEEAILLAMYLPRACSSSPKMSEEQFDSIAKGFRDLEDDFWHIAKVDVLTSDQFKIIGKLEDGSPKFEMGNRDVSMFFIDELKETYIKPYLNHEVTKNLLSKHAYTRTFIIAVILEARRLGVMAPCQMRWLKLYNRQIWALLQNIGRPSMYAEGMGAISHYFVEVAHGQPILEPNFDIAIKGFETQLQTYKYDKQLLEKWASFKEENVIDKAVKLQDKLKLEGKLKEGKEKLKS